jgi:hypothetical protein
MVCVTVLVILVMNSARAEVITIDGTIKSVDAKKRTITVKTGSKTLTLDVSGKTKIRVEGKDAGLDTLKTGQKVTLAYHDKLETVLTIDAGSSASGEAAQLQVAFRSVEIAIDENGACTLTVDSTKGVSGTPGDQGDVIEAASENKPEIVRLKNGSRRIDYDFTRLKSIEALIPQTLPSKSLKAQIRGQLSIDKDAGAFQLSPVSADRRLAFDLPSPMNTQVPFTLRTEFTRFDQGRFNIVFMLTGNCLCVALDQRYQNDEAGVVRVDWRDKRGRANSPVHLEQAEGWKSLLKYTQEQEKLTKHRFRIPSASFRKLEPQKRVSMYLGLLGDQPVLIRRLELTGKSFREAFDESK